jgi:uncharacterized LabA/DUF88 family protein
LANTAFQSKNELLNAVVYADYENILELLKAFGKDPLEMDFFKVIQDKLVADGLNIVDFIIYGNFEKKQSNCKHQTYFRSLGLQTRHSCNNGKSSSDLELTVDVLKDLYKNHNINIFIMISSDRDIIPLLKAIKYENKLSFIISTQNGFNQTVAKYADSHEYIEDIFQLEPLDPSLYQQDETETIINIDDIDVKTANPMDISRAQEVARYFYQSHIWKRASLLGEPVSLKGYLDVISKVVHRFRGDILDDFKLAHCLKYVTIYQDPKRGLCLKQGIKIDTAPNSLNCLME